MVVVVLLMAPVEPALVDGLMVEPLVDPPAPVVCAAAGSARASDRIPLMIKVVRILGSPEEWPMTPQVIVRARSKTAAIAIDNLPSGPG
ncbi:hypothetical protein DJ021_00455 [Phenylobacterium hankyongense]|uniref:Uncharacterized protein n=1 Tax=Phenylobacterium hankyongense TaxID=1813876 RepID=A0A328AXG3_9CAUL|nr:hypothetical protein DJ021_00455 [Phenylobacterium hankyongense]